MRPLVDGKGNLGKGPPSLLGGVDMTQEELLRERIARMEVQIDHLSRKMDENAEILKRLDAAFEQAKGAKWMLLSIAGAAGFIAGKSSSILAFFGIGAR